LRQSLPFDVPVTAGRICLIVPFVVYMIINLF
jgi:hypothetical protein